MRFPKPELLASLYIVTLWAGYALIRAPTSALNFYGQLWLLVASLSLVLLADKVADTFGPELRATWIYITVGLGGIVLSTLVALIYVLAFAELPYPSVFDIIYSVSKLSIFYGLMTEARRVEGGSPLKATVAIVAGTLVGGLLVSSYLTFTGAADVGFWQMAANVSYFLTDALLISAAVYLSMVYSGVFRTAYSIFSAGVATISIADALFAYCYGIGTYEKSYFLIDNFWALGFALAALGMMKIVNKAGEIEGTLIRLAKSRRRKGAVG